MPPPDRGAGPYGGVVTHTGSLASAGSPAGAPVPRRTRIPSGAWVLAASALAGLAVFAYFSLDSRFLGQAAQDRFAVYYSLSLLLGFGAFLPLEAELARTLGSRRDARAGLREGAVVALVVTVVVGAAVLAASAPLLDLLGGSGWLLAATVGVVAVSALQFWVRGALLGLGRTRAFAATLAVDSVLRLALAAVLLVVIGTRTAPLFTLSLLLPLLIAHGVFVPTVLRAGRAAARDTAEARPAGAVPEVAGSAGADRPQPLALLRRLLPLFAATLCAQVLLNAPVLLVKATAVPGSGATAAFFLAFNLARIPLFMAVPAQGAVVPPMAAMVAAGRTHAVVTTLLRVAAGLVGLAVVGGAVAAAAGPAVMGLLFPAVGSPPRLDLALMVVGVAANIGLLLTAQANVAADHHRASGIAWVSALVAAALVWLGAGAAGAGPLLRVETAFAAGSLVGWALAIVLLLRFARTARPGEAPTTAEDPHDTRDTRDLLEESA